MEFATGVKAALEQAWHKQSALSSLERWLEICDKEQWQCSPANLVRLAKVFGASWYFTRYIFFRGQDAVQLVELAEGQDFSYDAIKKRINAVLDADTMERQLDSLRLIKNEVMLQILICFLAERLDLKAMEQALTDLSETTLDILMEIFGLASDLPEQEIAVLGMGRMAGGEMTFGSDLDLIFLYRSESVDIMHELGRKIRLLLRNLSSVSAAGLLYEIDMRLRPHGTSGALVTAVNMFKEYHQSGREIWERQMMTRCRPVFDDCGLGQRTLKDISAYIYGYYDDQTLRGEIVAMRKRVQQEKGSITGKFEVKRGKGGLMDIDFLTHYLQLRHGGRYLQLQTGSTRNALKVALDLSLITQESGASLLESYEFLKRIETCLRLFDMKSISAFNREPQAHAPLARAMGFYDEQKPEAFLKKYFSVRDSVRGYFKEIVGDPEG